MNSRGEKGKTGEDIAANHLKENGYKIIKRNFRCRMGEIDIIAEKNGILSFVEVKTRSGFLYGNPSEAVDQRKRKHIINAARFFIMCHPEYRDSCIRMDIIEVIMKNNRNYIGVIENAFGEGE